MPGRHENLAILLVRMTMYAEGVKMAVLWNFFHAFLNGDMLVQFQCLAIHMYEIYA